METPCSTGQDPSVPGFVEEEELEQLLFDLFREQAMGSKRDIFRVARLKA